MNITSFLLSNGIKLFTTAILLIGSSPLYAQIYKCTVNDTTVYQQQPCAGAGEEMVMKKDDIILPAGSKAILPELAQQLADEATAILEAIRNRNYDFVVNNMAPELVTAMGGKATVIDKMSQGMQQFDEKNLAISDVTISKPTALHPSDDYDIVFLPSEMTVTGKEITVKSKNYLLASRRKNTTRWFFTDGTAASDEVALQILFPGISPDVNVPAQTHQVQNN